MAMMRLVVSAAISPPVASVTTLASQSTRAGALPTASSGTSHGSGRPPAAWLSTWRQIHRRNAWTSGCEGAVSTSPSRDRSRAAWIARSSVSKCATDPSGTGTSTRLADTSGSTASPISSSGLIATVARGTCSSRTAIASVASACIWMGSAASESRFASRYSRSSASACSCQAACSRRGMFRSSTSTLSRPMTATPGWSVRGSSRSGRSLSGPETRNHTVFPVRCRITPQSSTSDSSMSRPRPVPAVAAYRRREGRCGLPSPISTRRPLSSSRAATSMSVPACSRALVTSSLTSSTAVSARSSRSASSSRRRTCARASPTLEGCGGKPHLERAVTRHAGRQTHQSLLPIASTKAFGG